MAEHDALYQIEGEIILKSDIAKAYRGLRNFGISDKRAAFDIALDACIECEKVCRRLAECETR